MIKYSWIVITCLFLVVGQSAATPGLPGAHDARSVGMGGAGVASATNASAVFHNPALLQQIDKLSLTLSTSPFFPSGEAPFADANGINQRRGASSLVPLFFAAGAYRISDRVVLGLGVYSSTGFGGRFKDILELGGESLDLVVGSAEVAMPVSVDIGNGFSVSAGLRLAYVFQRIEIFVPNQANAGQFLRIDQDLSGFKGPGIFAGALYNTKGLRIGVSYRSRLDVALDGTVTFPEQGPQKFDAKAKFNLEHQVRAGVAVDIIPKRWLLVGELFARFHKSANKELVTEVTVGPGTQQIPFSLQWDNSYGGRIGSELWVTPQIPVRAGYFIGNSATPGSNASPFLPPPGMLHALSVGSGWRQARFGIDAAAMVFWGDSNVVVSDDPVNGPPGNYKSVSTMVSLSASYRL